MSEEEKIDKRLPFNLKPIAKVKLNLLQTHFNSMNLQNTIERCIDDSYDRHYKAIICEAEKIAGPQNAINATHGRERPQG